MEDHHADRLPALQAPSRFLQREHLLPVLRKPHARDRRERAENGLFLVVLRPGAAAISGNCEGPEDRLAIYRSDNPRADRAYTRRACKLVVVQTQEGTGRTVAEVEPGHANDERQATTRKSQ